MEGNWAGTPGRCNLDAETLDCPICTDPLSPPVYQCENGHIICSACCENLHGSKACPSCTQPTGRMRNLAVEKIIESVLVQCKHGLNGCTQMLPLCKLADRQDHEERTCKFQPIPCSLPWCSHEAPLAQFSLHLAEEHGVARSEWDVVKGRPCVKLEMSGEDGYRMVELAGGLLLVQREDEIGGGDAFCCTAYGASVTCKLKVKRTAAAMLPSSYRMKAPLLDWSRRSLRESCSFVDRLVVPADDRLRGQFHLTLSIVYLAAASDVQDLADSPCSSHGL